MKSIILFALLLCAGNAISQVKPVDTDGKAIGGYDVVAYFTTGKALQGNQQNAAQYKGVRYLFSTHENQILFEADPEKYLPQFDGYCALAVSYGKKISIDPETFKITNGKLYLFFHRKTGDKKVNSLDTWVKNEERLLKKADELWPDVKKKKFKEEDSL